MSLREPPNQRTLKAEDVQREVGLTRPEWRHVKQEASDYCRVHLSVPWGRQSEEEKRNHCNAFRSSIQYSEKFVLCEGKYTMPWACWFLLSVAAKSKEAPQSNATRPPRPSTGQGPPPGESASGASEASAEDPVPPEVTQSDSLHSQGVSAPQSVEDFGIATQQKSPFRGLPYDPTKKGETQI